MTLHHDKNEIDQDTKINLPIRAVWSLVGVFAMATFWLGGIYARTHDLPERVSKIEQALDERNGRDKMTCKVLRRIQDQVVPEVYREKMDCL
jgi:hypothetical protein